VRHTLLSQKPDPRRCKSYTLIKTCKCVEFYNFLILSIFGAPFNHDSLSLDECLLLESMGYLYFFFSFRQAPWHDFFLSHSF
jgi:hypothetical protein